MTFQRYTPPAGAEMKPDSKGKFYLASEVDKEIERLNKSIEEMKNAK